MNERNGWKTLGVLFAGMIATLVLVTSCASLAGGGGGGTPPNTGSGYIANTITVNGYGQAEGTPDVAFVQLGVSIVDPDVGRAVSENNRKMQAVQDAIIEAGIAIDDIQTVGFNVWPEDRYDPQTGQPTGERVYHVDNTLSIKVHALDTTGQIIQAGLEAGANTVNSLTFGVEDTAALEAEARQDAVDDARARAEQLAQSLGVTLGPPVLVTEGGASPPVGTPYYPIAADGFGGGGGGPAINPGQLTFTDSVYVVFSIK